jgi:TolA-binding protein
VSDNIYRKTHNGWKHGSGGWLVREQSPDEPRIQKLEEQNRLLNAKLEELSQIFDKISCYTDPVSNE